MLIIRPEELYPPIDGLRLFLILLTLGTLYYAPPTYLNLALATVYVRLAAPEGLDWLRIDRRMLARLAGSPFSAT